jgi:hypothetical protein
MAFTPCAFHGAKYSGGASTFFLRLVNGGNARGGKLQVCPNCAVLALDYLSERAIKVSEGDSFVDYADPIGCMNCGGDVQQGALGFYGNAYPRGRVETQWYAKCCATCADVVAEELHLDAGRARA